MADGICLPFLGHILGFGPGPVQFFLKQYDKVGFYPFCSLSHIASLATFSLSNFLVVIVSSWVEQKPKLHSMNLLMKFLVLQKLINLLFQLLAQGSFMM